MAVQQNKKSAFAAQYAPHARPPEQPTAGDRAGLGRSPSAPPHQPQRLLSAARRSSSPRKTEPCLPASWSCLPALNSDFRHHARADAQRRSDGSLARQARLRPERHSQLMGITIALDCMGGDHGAARHRSRRPELSSPQPRCQRHAGRRPGAHREHEIEARARAADPRIRVQHASEVVAMDDTPAVALRSKRDSSMRVAVDLVKNGDADACVSAGNTGALMAISRFVLKMLPGVERPAIASMVPTMRGRTCVLDLGRQRRLHRRAPAAVRRHGRGAVLGRGEGRASQRGAAQHRRRGHQGQRGGEASRASCSRRAA